MRVNELAEKFLPQKGLRLVDKVEFPKATIYLAETDYMNDRPREFPTGYYQTAFFVAAKASNGDIDGGVYFEFDALHDKDKSWSQEVKRLARHNATIEQAKDWINKNIEKDRY